MPHSTPEKRREYLRVRLESEAPEQREARLRNRRAIVKKSDDKHRAKRRVYSKGYHAKNAKRRSDYQKSILPRINAQRKLRMERDVNYRIRCNLGSRIRIAIRFCKGSKQDRTKELVGCDAILLRAWLERQFQPGMSWDNYGQWHVDHIIPCAEFDLTKRDQQLTCFHYSNLRPLWAAENLSRNKPRAKKPV